MHVSALSAAVAAGIIGSATCSEIPYSRRMIDSVKIRNQGVISSGAASVYLEGGFLAQAMLDTIALYPHSEHVESDKKYIIDVLNTAASHPLRNASDYAKRPLDRFSLGSSINRAGKAGISITPNATSALEAINASLPLQKRNPDGGIWFYTYENWSYLDGMFSLMPFMADIPRTNETDMDLQITLLQTHCKASDHPLLVHGYDWAKKAVWANKTTGASPYVWGRSLGWYLAGLVQIYEALDCANSKTGDRPLCNHIRNTTTDISSKAIQYADPKTGAWLQLTTLPNHNGNYPESSSTALIIFSLLKGLRIGVIPATLKTSFKDAAIRAYNYTSKNFVVDLGNGTVEYDWTVSVCSLNSTATYEYYTKQPILRNSLLGESAFIMASLEVERLSL